LKIKLILNNLNNLKMSLYADPGYFTEHLTDLTAPDEIP
jgi:hypothetical protein